MNKKDLDALKELYLSVYDEEQLNEAPLTPEEIRFRNERAQLGVIRQGGKFVTTGKTDPNLSSPGEYMFAALTGGRNPRERQQKRASSLANRLNNQERISKTQDAAIAAADKAEKPPTKPPASTPTAAKPAAGSGSTPPPRPAARPSGPVLSKKDGVEGTGVGADFKARAFTAAEKSRYSSVAAQNAARSSAASGTPKPSSPTPAASAPKPAIGKLGNTSFERRTPTSAELSGAQGAPAGSTPEQRLQAAQKKTFGPPTTGPTPAIPSASSIVAAGANSTPRDMNKYPIKPATPGTNSINNLKQQGKTVNSSYEWPSAKTIRDIAGAYASIYEAKTKEYDASRDKDDDGDNDFADNMVARMVASGMSREEAIKKVKNKEYNKEEFELVDEATRMGKELGKEGEIATRKQLAARSDAHQRSGSVDRTIAAAEKGADRPYVKPVRGESDANRAARERKQSQTLSGLAASRRGSVRDKPRAGLRGYAADVKGSDKELQSSRRSAMAAGTLTPREKKMLNKEAYETYELVASYLLENNFASTVEDANVIINNMSEGWFNQIIEG